MNQDPKSQLETIPVRPWATDSEVGENAELKPEDLEKITGANGGYGTNHNQNLFTD